MSRIEFFGKIIGEGGLQQKKSREKVAAVALNKLLGVTLPEWSVYTGANAAQPNVLNLAMSLDNTKVEYYARRAKGNDIFF